MASETVELKPRKGDSTSGLAVITRVPSGIRAAKASGFVAVGLLGVGTVVVPGVHFVGPWLIPLVGIGLGWSTWKKDKVVHSVNGSCPHCGASASWSDVVVDDQIWERCPACREPIEVVFLEDVD